MIEVEDIPSSFPKRGFSHKSIIIDSRGKASEYGNYVWGQRVVVHLFEIYSNPTIKISDVKARKFSLIDRK